ncbi:MAG: 2-phospho-L-lactate guanylyltransferase [Burkholderiales bacterium]|nr:2-phospho-L-lactate guanylyltransferase [Burkholderiales bacterium]
MSPGPWTIVPVRGIAAGKTRLAAVLDAPARARLNRRLLEHTLGVVALWSGGLERCLVVSACPETRVLATRRGAVAVAETRPAAGLNAALTLAAARAAGAGASRALVLASDLPRLVPEALAVLASAAAAGRRMAIAPDSRREGTNALVLPLEAPYEFRYGEQSFARHLALAAGRGWSAAVVERAELAFDLDTPEDLAGWPGLAAPGAGAGGPG